MSLRLDCLDVGQLLTRLRAYRCSSARTENLYLSELAQRFLRPPADDVKGILELVPVNLHPTLSSRLELTEKLAGLLDVVALPLQP